MNSQWYNQRLQTLRCKPAVSEVRNEGQGGDCTVSRITVKSFPLSRRTLATTCADLSDSSSDGPITFCIRKASADFLTTPSRRRPFPLLGVGWWAVTDSHINNSAPSWGGLMASMQTGRLAGRYRGEQPMCFPVQSLFVSWMWRKRRLAGSFQAPGLIKD